jgi:hypothetical protein
MMQLLMTRKSTMWIKTRGSHHQLATPRGPLLLLLLLLKAHQAATRLRSERGVARIA